MELIVVFCYSPYCSSSGNNCLYYTYNKLTNQFPVEVGDMLEYHLFTWHLPKSHTAQVFMTVSLIWEQIPHRHERCHLFLSTEKVLSGVIFKKKIL